MGWMNLFPVKIAWLKIWEMVDVVSYAIEPSYKRLDWSRPSVGSKGAPNFTKYMSKSLLE